MYQRFLSIVICALLTVQTALAQTRIAVMSDSHVSSKTTSAGERKMLDKSRVIFDRLIRQFKIQKPNLLLVTGDLTETGDIENHQYVKAGLDQLKAVGVKVFVIPGNHDFGTLDEEGFRMMYADYGYGAASVKDSTSLSYACEPMKGLTLIGIDSHSGYLSETTLNWVCQQAEEARNKGRQVIAMMHHPLFPHFNNADLFISTSTIGNYENVRNKLADAGIKVILTGHFHTSDIAKDWNEDLSREIYDINTGSAVSYPCDYRMLTLSRDLKELTVTTKHIDTLPGEANFAKTAKERLYASMYNLAYQKIASRGSFGDNEKKQLADIAARAFIVHAEGNEASHAEVVGQINSDLNRLGSGGNFLIKTVITYLKPTIESVLTDTSNLGDPERENRTDDLTLSIKLAD